eukprot:c26901_g1_i1 orf=280-1491(+)
MGKKKKKIAKVWCYYCEREFEDEKILVQHQKAKHFKCHVCHKKLSTAGGMVIHVLQVHKESITKVPNSKPDRESTEIEIFGMEGIPPEVLAAHEGEQEEDKPAKAARVEVPPSGLGVMVMGSTALGMNPQPMYSAMPPVYMPPATSAVPRPPVWPPQPPSSQPWSMRPAIPGPSVLPLRLPPPPPPASPHPLFPIQVLRTPPAISPVPSQPPSQPLFPIHPPLPPSSRPVPPLPLFPLNGPSPVSHPSLPVASSVSLVSMPAVVQTGPSIDSRSVTEAGPSPSFIPLHASSPLIMAVKPEIPRPFGGMAVTPVTSNHMYASGPNTGGPSIGPPPVISNKAPSQGIANEVYLVWDDEAMSMEERRISLQQYQVHDEASQMNSVDAAIDKRILESRLADRLTFGV